MAAAAARRARAIGSASSSSRRWRRISLSTVYGECIIRTATTNGLVLLTFTPLEGISEVVMSFMPKEMRPGDAFE